MNPASCAAEARAVLAALALQQIDLPWGRTFRLLGRRAVGQQPATDRVRHVDVPLAHEGGGLGPFKWNRVIAHRAVLVRAVAHKLCDVEPDATGADDRDRLADTFRPVEDVDVARDLGVILAGDAEGARRHSGRENDLIEAARQQVVGRYTRVQPEIDAGDRNLAVEVTEGLVELLLAGHLLGVM